MSAITTKKHANGLEYVNVDTPLCQARIFLQGAQIEFFQPKNQAPLLWVSSADDYQAGYGIRGGIPICWPWFGMHSNPDWPQHGFARTRIWDLTSTQILESGVELNFTLELNEEDTRYWPHHTQIAIQFILNNTLTVSLINTNLSSNTVKLTQALHSYFPITDITTLKAKGFEGAKYLEFGEGPFKQHNNEVVFNKETDRVYTELGQIQTLETPEGIIEVSRKNSRSAVLWNPWIDKSQQLSRFNAEDYASMVCLEAANVLEDAVILAPHETHTLTTQIRWKN
ncbi:D-hexose-6-phosphate mutarotase [Shewanella sp. VB17]|uniref:D-hexose-6-phosphate mutarotase n=1 Tax=Shewanella sp. VB17 TaxID=2739432 RepID=UPI001566408A|nr:D-hexose-6-phosphate mutarotase [Shewanella sp. VB17]NRD73609.1 D-hexose-6-phosphate mutarotase [Shewanella sp. VB17]